MRRTEATLAILLAAGLVAAVILGQHAAPDQRLRDARSSTFGSGPAGAKALAETVRRLGVPVVQKRTSFFNLVVPPREQGRVLYAFLNLPPAMVPTDPEIAAIVALPRDGGHIFVAGPTAIESCFHYRVSRAPRRDRDADTVAAARDLPPATFVLRRDPLDSKEDSARYHEVCGRLVTERADTLFRTQSGAVLAVRHEFAGGGTATLLADPAWITNRSLRDTDVGPLVISWLLAIRPDRIVVDEYHQGYGSEGSLMGAAWRWMWGTPAGWTVVQLLFAALVGLAATGVRFGPALSVIERRRRSPLEHLEALATGLERAEGRSTALRLLVAGLQRRLHRAGGAARRGEQDTDRWLASLGLAARTPTAQSAVRRLGHLTRQRGGDQQVLDAAIAVEDVWEALGPERKHTPS